MRHIGIAATTAPGAALFYTTLVNESAARFGSDSQLEISLHHAPAVVNLRAQQERDWTTVAELMVASIKVLADIGAQLAVIPSNSVHYAYSEIEKRAPIPMMSIVECAADECQKRGYRKVLVCGVGVTMSDGLYAAPLQTRSIDYLTPDDEDQTAMSTIIYEELLRGIVVPTSQKRLQAIISGAANRGCDAAVLACTELPLALHSDNSPVPLVDTTAVLAHRVLDRVAL